jgi:hypothetical protein
MGRPLKKGRYVNVNIDMDAYDLLEKHCVESGQTKTIAIERAIRICYGDKSENDFKTLIARSNIN